MLGIHPLVTTILAGDHRVKDGLTGIPFLSLLNNNFQNPDTELYIEIKLNKKIVFIKRVRNTAKRL